MAAASYVAVLVALAAAALAVLCGMQCFGPKTRELQGKVEFSLERLEDRHVPSKSFPCSMHEFDLMIPSLDGGDQSF